jgi:hypothetical protein
MAIDLNSISRGQRIGPPRLIIYGPHGVGKNTFAASAPNPIFIPLEEGQGALDVASFPLLKSYGEVLEALGTLYTGEHEFQTVVIDSLDWLEPLIWRETCTRSGWSNIEEPGWGKGYTEADNVWREFFDGLVALRETKQMSVVLTAHCEIKKFNDPNTESYDRYQIKLHSRGSAIAQEWADGVLFANYKVYTEKSDAGFKKTIVRGKGHGERLLFTEERPAHYAKNRWSLPPEMPFPRDGAFPVLLDHIFGKAQAPAVEEQPAEAA